jgi:phage anti-repressor protein
MILEFAKYELSDDFAREIFMCYSDDNHNAVQNEAIKNMKILNQKKNEVE